MLIDGHPLESPCAPLNDLLAAGLATPDEVALVSADRSLTWGELEAASVRLAGGYRALGLEPGDRLASLMPNRIDLIVHYLACFKADLIATPLNYRYTFREIDHALEVSGATALLAHVERVADVAASGLAAQLARGTIGYADGAAAAPADGWGQSFEALVESEPLAAGRPPLDPASPAVIFFTSGSTGPAKGVTHTRESLRWMIASAAAAFALDRSDVFLPGSSMSHVGSFLWALSTLSVGGRVVVARTTDSHEILPLLRQQRPTVLAMIPAALSALIRDHDLQPGDFASLRICRAGSDKVSTELLHEFAAAGFPIVEGYGMTEVGLATLNPPGGEVKQGSIGPPVSGFSIAVRGEDGEPVGAESVGRIWIRSRSRMAGYWEAPEATEEVLLDDWLDSGDLARADEDGYLWFFGRKKQVIVHDGSNISPLEVEGALVEHPAVALAGVVGVHDTVHGENVRAYVTLREGAERPSSADLIVFCRERVGYKAPEEVVFLEEMPLNPTGKIDRVGLKRMAEDHLHPHGLDSGQAPDGRG
jgi:acyl-CoA synthetase (AMP-forming)/AMP-acid ligase II